MNITPAGRSLPVTHPPAPSLSVHHRSAPSVLAKLTDADRDVIFHATGERLTTTSQAGPLLAFQIAQDRADGSLSPGQQVGVEYFQQMLDHYQNRGVRNQGFEHQLRGAVDYLARLPRPGLDVNA